MRKIRLLFSVLFFFNHAFAQQPVTTTSSEILLHLKKLPVYGSVLYIAAHPDDENTALLTYLANEKLYRTGYLSLTRGDGGQNLIGDEQGPELGMIRTRELLAARRIDGAEQFFSTAFDFGFCKTPEEALQTWGHEKILADVVWVIRRFRPDIIITRFPEDSRAGHGHHSASAILAREAFDAAADQSRFTEQFKEGVSSWQVKRLLWNTMNFNAPADAPPGKNQYKELVGMYNPLLGKSYGEIAALSRSQHKSQGFGVPANHELAADFFETVKGEAPVNSLMDGLNNTCFRLSDDPVLLQSINGLTDSLIKSFDPVHPQQSVAGLVSLYKMTGNLKDAYWREQKQNEIRNCIAECSGWFMEVTASAPYAVQGDSLRLTCQFINREQLDIQDLRVQVEDSVMQFHRENKWSFVAKSLAIALPVSRYPVTIPYWLQKEKSKGNYNVANQQWIGLPEIPVFKAIFSVNFQGTIIDFTQPVRYKYTDPVKGELYQPLSIVPKISVSYSPELVLKKTVGPTKATRKIRLLVNGKQLAPETIAFKELQGLPSGAVYANEYTVANSLTDTNYTVREIVYDHIPAIRYCKSARQQLVTVDLKITGKKIGYIIGAGDKVPAALEQMGYQVTFLKEADMNKHVLRQFDAIVTGVRAYNIHEWLNNAYDVLMDYIKEGGVLLTQYNTNNQIGPVKARMAPYPFTISKNRITDELATVKFLLPENPAVNIPNKITSTDFEGWVQERSIYNAEDIDPHYQRIFSMKDPGEKEQDGSLIIANYGKGKFIYSGLVFYRELPAGVPGAYRLMANLLSK